MQLHPILSALLRSKTGAVLVAAQVALTIAIVCNALFVVDARLATASRPSGVDEDAVFQLQYVGAGEVTDRSAMVQRDLEVLRAMPGVVAAAYTNSIPLSSSGSTHGITAEPSKPDASVGVSAYYSGDGFVDALGLKIVEGRDFEPGEIREVDGRTEKAIAETTIISRALGRTLFPDDTSYVGKTIYQGDGPDARPMRVVGVVETLMSSHGQPDESAYRAFIIPVRFLRGDANYAIRTAPGQLARIMTESEQALTALRNDRVKVNHRSVAQMRDRRFKQERAGATMLIAVTIGLLLVTASGIVGVSSLWVNQRRKQIGIRRALGARRIDILRYFLAENLIITTAGIVAGVAFAIGLNQYLVSKVELARLPVIYLVVGMGAAWVLGLAAVLGPAWRASWVPPAVATRTT